MDKLIAEYVEKIRKIDNVSQYDEIISTLNRKLEEMDYPKEFCELVKEKQRYLKNRFSEEANKEKMLVAKDKLLKCLTDYLYEKNEHDAKDTLIKYLTGFYMFMEALSEREPDKRATLTHDMLQNMKIENEYDLQHLLYAVLKPLYPDIRKEVAEDSGVGTVRIDLKIPSLYSAVETKCTREKMNLKKLTEEIEADIVHYSERHIIFLVYDKWKIIKDKVTYEDYFNRLFDGKEVKIIIHQPIIL